MPGMHASKAPAQASLVGGRHVRYHHVSETCGKLLNFSCVTSVWSESLEAFAKTMDRIFVPEAEAECEEEEVVQAMDAKFLLYKGQQTRRFSLPPLSLSLSLSLSVYLCLSLSLSLSLPPLSVFLSFCLSVFLSFCLSVFLSFCLSVFLSFCLSVFLSFCLSVFLSFCLSVFLSFCLSVFLSFCLSVFLSFCLSVFLSFCLSVFLSFCLSVFLSFCLPFVILFFIPFFLSFFHSFFLSFLLPFLLSFLLSFLPSFFLSFFLSFFSLSPSVCLCLLGLQARAARDGNIGTEEGLSPNPSPIQSDVPGMGRESALSAVHYVPCSESRESSAG